MLAQGGHGTQWIGAGRSRAACEAIPQYYLTGYTGAALGHGVELLVALPILAGVVYRAVARARRRREERGALIALALAACGDADPARARRLGADYLAPRNLVGGDGPADRRCSPSS